MKVIGIAGGSASGKSTLAAAMSDVLRGSDTSLVCEIMSLDHYVLDDKSQGPWVTMPTTGENIFNWNHPDSYDIEKIVGHVLARGTVVESPDFLVVEGLMALHFTKLRDTMDLKVFVELEADNRALRRLLRDIQGGRTSTDPQFIAEYYLTSAQPGHNAFVEPSRTHADIVVRGNSNALESAQRIVAIARYAA